jgi:histidine triad (HIT) family protein
VEAPDDPRCIFCAIVQGKDPAATVYEDDDHVAFMDINPVNRGHVLVLPKAHYETLFEMDAQEVGTLFARVTDVACAVREAMGADGMNIGQNNGRVAQQIVPHVHVHVIPRYRGDSPAGRWPTRKRAPLEELEAAAARIREAVRARATGGAPPGS